MSFSGTKGHLTKPKPGVMLNLLHPLSRGLVGYWLLNEGAGSRINDISGKDNHGTLRNIVPNIQGWAGSKFGGRLNFDGWNDYVHIPDNDSLSFTDGSNDLPFSVSMIINVDAHDGYNGMNWIISKDGKVSDVWQREWGLYTSSGRITLILLTLGSTAHIRNRYSVALNTSQWYIITATYDGSKSETGIKIYADGVQVDDTPVEDGTYTGMTNGTSPLYFGTFYPEATQDYSFNGSMVFACLHGRMLSLQEVKQLHSNPFCNLLQIPIRRYSLITPPIGAIMNQFQMNNLGADLYDGAIIA